MSAVTAIVVGPSDGVPGAAFEGTATALCVPGLHAVADAARDAATPLVWILDAAAAPSSETLPTLLRHDDAPAVSLPIDERGVPLEGLLVGFAHDDVPLMLAEAERCRVPLRHAHVVSLLASRDAVVAAGPPRPEIFGGQAGVAWTARLFAERPGMLIPESRVVVPAPERPPVRDALRLVRAGVWGRDDLLREMRLVLGPAR